MKKNVLLCLGLALLTLAAGCGTKNAKIDEITVQADTVLRIGISTSAEDARAIAANQFAAELIKRMVDFFFDFLDAVEVDSAFTLRHV